MKRDMATSKKASLEFFDGEKRRVREAAEFNIQW